MVVCGCEAGVSTVWGRLIAVQHSQGGRARRFSFVGRLFTQLTREKQRARGLNPCYPQFTHNLLRGKETDTKGDLNYE